MKSTRIEYGSEPCTILVADPPWSFGDKIQGDGRGAEKHYDVLDLPDIMRFDLPIFAPQAAVLFLWRVSSQVEEAYQVVRAWGFTPKSELVWVKKTSQGNRHIGMGHIVRGEHETCIVATRGKLIVPADKGVRTVFEAPVGKHSEKPDAFYELVEKLYPIAMGRHVELFARRLRAGWHCFGNELDSPPPAVSGSYEAHVAQQNGKAAADAKNHARRLDGWDRALARAATDMPVETRHKPLIDAPPIAHDEPEHVTPGHGVIASATDTALVTRTLPELTDLQKVDAVCRAIAEGILPNGISGDEGWAKLMKAVPLEWHFVKKSAPENLSDIAVALDKRGVHVDLKDLATWAAVEREAAHDWACEKLLHDHVPPRIAELGPRDGKTPAAAPSKGAPKAPGKRGRKKKADRWAIAAARAEAEE